MKNNKSPSPTEKGRTDKYAASFQGFAESYKAEILRALGLEDVRGPLSRAADLLHYTPSGLYKQFDGQRFLVTGLQARLAERGCTIVISSAGIDVLPPVDENGEPVYPTPEPSESEGPTDG